MRSKALSRTMRLRDDMVNITFEFVGGPKDGTVLCGRLGEPSDAERHYLFTNHGAVGQRFKVASDYAIETLASEQLKEETPHHFQQHYYIVTDRHEEDDSIRVFAEYLPEAVER